MNVAMKHAGASDLAAAGGWWQTVPAAARRITWRSVGATLAISALLEAWTVFETTVDGADKGGDAQFSSAQLYASAAIINLAMGFAIMFATRVADEFVRRGARRRIVYPLAVVAGSAAGALLQWGVHRGLDLPTRYDMPGVPHDVSIMQPAVVLFEYLIWGSIFVFLYVNRRTALIASARMNLAQTGTARARRHALESRLQALQARVEPQFLFNTLAKVRALYDDDPERGATLLQDLIVYLRAALPQLRDSTSTLGQELQLACAYLSILRTQMGDRLEFAIDAPRTQADLGARLPPMILLPLVDHLLAGGTKALAAGETLGVAARLGAGRLRIEIDVGGRGSLAQRSGDLLSDIRERLRALYGDSALLVVESSAAPGTRVVMEIPHESADGDHR
jgi:hypothetical protein